MKRTLYCGLMILVAGGGLIAYVMAQQPATQTSVAAETIQQAQGLIRAGKPLEARTVLATIPETAPEYPLAKQVDALAQHEAKDWLGFLKALEKLPAASGIPATVSADLTARQIEALLFYRSFEELLPKARAFPSRYQGAAQTGAVQDYLLAALFERGMKKTEDACRSKDEVVFNKRWPEGKANLEEFLALVASTGTADYQSLPKRNLKQDVWIARLTLGDEKALWSELPANDAAARESVSFLRLRLFQELQRSETEKNLQIARDFLQQFPESVHSKRVEYEAAGVALYGGTRLAEESRNEGNPEAAAQKRATAGRYLELAREWYSRVVEDKVAGISAADVQQSRVAMLRICFAKEDWGGLSNWAAHLVATSPSEEKVWVLSKLYHGVGLVRQGKLAEAAKELDQVLAIGFKGHPSYDGHLISAVKWRIYIARTSDDLPKARELMQWVKESNCRSSTKNPFLWEYRGLLWEETPSIK